MSRPPVPVPASVSVAAQEYLASPMVFGDATPPDDPSDLKAWDRYIAERNDVIGRVLADLVPADLPVEGSEIDLDGVTTYVFRPHHVPDSVDPPIYLDIHGGALVFGGGDTCRAMAGATALTRPMITWAVDYRVPPRHPYPAALDDCLAVYRKALDERPPTSVFVGGASAGGNLASALLLRAKDEGLPMPAALVLITPEVDLTESGDSFQTNLGIDNVLTESLMTTNLLYAGGHDLAHPYLSPLFGDLTDFPPTFVQAGTRDLFLSNAVRMHRTLLAAGVEAELHVFEAMPHGGFGGTTPEDLDLIVSVQRFLDRHSRRSEGPVGSTG